MNEMIEFSMYGTQENFTEDFIEMNKQLAPYNARFVTPSGLGGGEPIESILYIYLSIVTEIVKDFLLNGGYDLFKSQVLKLYHKFIKHADEKNMNCVVYVSRLRGPNYNKIEIDNPTEEVLLHTIDRFF